MADKKNPMLRYGAIGDDAKPKKKVKGKRGAKTTKNKINDNKWDDKEVGKRLQNDSRDRNMDEAKQARRAVDKGSDTKKMKDAGDFLTTKDTAANRTASAGKKAEKLKKASKVTAKSGAGPVDKDKDYASKSRKKNIKKNSGKAIAKKVAGKTAAKLVPGLGAALMAKDAYDFGKTTKELVQAKAAVKKAKKTADKTGKDAIKKQQAKKKAPAKASEKKYNPNSEQEKYIEDNKGNVMWNPLYGVGYEYAKLKDTKRNVARKKGEKK